MRNESIDIAAFDAISLQNLFAKIGHLAHCVLEDRLPVLMNVVHLFFHGFVG